MGRDSQYCDDCGDELHGEEFVAYTHVPFNVASANEGESAVLCFSCNKHHKMLRALKVITLDPRISNWLIKNDPQALKQAVEAVKTAEQ